MLEQKEDSWGVLSKPSHCSARQAQSLNAQVVWPLRVCRKVSPWIARDAVLCAKIQATRVLPERRLFFFFFRSGSRGKITLGRAPLSLWTRTEKHNLSAATGRKMGENRLKVVLLQVPLGYQHFYSAVFIRHFCINHAHFHSSTNHTIVRGNQTTA